MFSPFLPPELECEIFETTAEIYPGSVPSLLCVSKRVHEWIERIKFNTVTPGEGALASCPLRVLLEAIDSESKPPTFFHNSVRHLFLPRSGLHRVQQVISVCTGLQTLWLGHEPHQSVFLCLAAIRPRRLGIYIEPLLEEPETCLPMFTFVTHLDILDFSPRIPADRVPSWTSFITRLPALTHLVGMAGFMGAIIPDILALSPALKVLVVQDETKAANIISDVRYVCRLYKDVPDYWADWIGGTRGERDFWVRAEAFVAKKRRGEIQPSTRCWIEDEDGI
ncbi:hypothetical protein DFH06DRAFT_1316588 [Mycena polygramma]|nr:hypothetical protein DFH06DRAFT_1316588 [Mycena polygramma]